MDVRIHRCRFCNKEYHYQASGEGCHEPTNDERYCPRCMTIINQALEEKVPKEDRYFRRAVEVDKDDLIRILGSDIFDRMTALKKEELAKKNLFNVSIMVGLPYRNIDIFTIDRRRVYIASNDKDGNTDEHYFLDKCCRLSDKEAIEDWFEWSSNHYNHGCSMMSFTMMLSDVVRKRGFAKFPSPSELPELPMFWEVNHKDKPKP